MLRACSDAGVDGVHAGLDAAAPARAARLTDAIRRADRPPRFVVLVAPPLDDRARLEAPGGDPSLRNTDPPRVLDPWPIGVSLLLELGRGRDASAAAMPPRDLLDRVVRSGGFAAWGVGYEEPPGTAALRKDLESRPSWIRFPFHPLSPGPASEALALARTASVPVIASDPFADGRLDGSRLRGSPLETSGRPAPADWSEVRRTWAPVLSLGFLTDGHERTLAQASIQYVLGTEGVEGALVPAADSATLMEAALALQRPDLSTAQRDRIDRLRASGRDSRGADPAPVLK